MQLSIFKNRSLPMKQYVINSPVVYNFFKRPIVAHRVFNVIRQTRPKYLYLFSDGPRDKAEEKLINQNRQLIDDLIDWDCEVIKYYLNTNLGMDRIMKLTFEEVFKNHDRMIFLEEDILPSLSFFRFCDDLLEYYKNDESVYLIGGMNSLEKYPNYSDSDPSYIFKEVVSTWGMAIWKRSYALMQYDLSFLDSPYYSEVVKNNLTYKNKFNTFQHMMLKRDNPEKIPFDGEFYLMGLNHNIMYNSVAILPSRNLVLNIGDTEGAENGDEIIMYPRAMRNNSKLSLYEINFPLKHPPFKIVDYYSEIHLSKQPKLFLKFINKIERGLRVLIFGGPKKFFKKTKRFIKRTIGYDRHLRRYK